VTGVAAIPAVTAPARKRAVAAATVACVAHHLEETDQTRRAYEKTDHLAAPPSSFVVTIVERA
jgi:hypothetical protein